MAQLKYKRTLLKISGESLKGNKEHGYDADAVRTIVRRVKEALDMGAQIALVVGAGNIWRGLAGSQGGMDRVTADHMGMLATVMNALCLKDAFTSAGIPCHVHAASELAPFAPRFDRDQALAQLDKGELVIFAAGTGCPYFTTDTTAALRALEIKAQALLKATKVNGIYTADPMKDPKAKKYGSLRYETALEKRLKVMDSAAFALCMDNAIPIVVFDFFDGNALERVVKGEAVGTLVN